MTIFRVFYDKIIKKFIKIFFPFKNLVNIENDFIKNYLNILNNDYLIIEYFNELLESYNNNYEEIYFTKKFNHADRLVEYIMKDNISISFIRKIIYYKIFLNFMKFHYKEFIKFGAVYKVDNIDIMFIAKFKSRDGWLGSSNKLGYCKIVGEIKTIDFLKLVLRVEEKIVELDEKYDIECWSEINIKFV